jgi:hypothetical protein
MEPKMSRKRKSPYGSPMRAFKAGFVDGLQSPLRIFSFHVALKTPIGAKSGAFRLRRNAYAGAAEFIRYGFKVTRLNDPRLNEKLAAGCPNSPQGFSFPKREAPPRFRATAASKIAK